MRAAVNPFTDAGLPSGPGSDAVYRAVARVLMDRAEEDGWDQPAWLWAVVDAATTEVLVGSEAREQARAELGIPDADADGGFTVGYSIAAIEQVDGHPRTALPGVLAPPQVAAVVLVAEAWRSPDPQAQYARASLDPDRVETRLVSIVDRSGVVHDFRRDRGAPADALEEVSDADPFAGRVTALLARVLGVDVSPRRPVGQVLGRAALALTTARVRLTGLGPEQGAAWGVPALVLTVAGLLDGLATPWTPRLDVPNLGAVMDTRGELSRAVTSLGDLRAADDTGETHPVVLRVFEEAAEVAAHGWDGFWQAPGAARWCYRDESDALLTGELWDWYGPGLRSALIDDVLVHPDDVVADATATLGAAGADAVLGFLRAVGWDPQAAA